VARAVAWVVIAIILITPRVVVIGVGLLFITEALIGFPIVRQLSIRIHLSFAWRWVELMI
jgi:hypothetical protein